MGPVGLLACSHSLGPGQPDEVLLQSVTLLPDGLSGPVRAAGHLVSNTSEITQVNP